MSDIQTEIATIKDRIVQIQIDIARLVGTTDPHNLGEDDAKEFRRISAELASLRTRLAVIMGRPPR